jgi:nucleoside-diphosphate-sugar epimerase
LNTALSDSIYEILDRSRDDLNQLRDARIFITGGTGFVGTWLLKSLTAANDLLSLRVSMTVLTRSPSRFASSHPQLAESVELVQGDVTDFELVGAFDAAVHAATPASAALNDAHPEVMRETIELGMKTVLASLDANGQIPVLFTSSGAVYGTQPPTMERIPETYWPDETRIDPRNAYAFGKRAAEEIAAQIGSNGPAVKTARLFAFAGPGLPLDAHFAIGNFIRDALDGGPIRVRGDGSAVRSYMFAGDLISAMLAVLVRGEPGAAYNVGSEHAVSMRDLSVTVERVLKPGCGIEVEGLPPGELPTGAGNRYIPNIERLTELMRCEPCPTSLEESIRRTAAWARSSDRKP